MYFDQNFLGRTRCSFGMVLFCENNSFYYFRSISCDIVGCMLILNDQYIFSYSYTKDWLSLYSVIFVYVFSFPYYLNRLS